MSEVRVINSKRGSSKIVEVKRTKVSKKKAKKVVEVTKEEDKD